MNIFFNRETFNTMNKVKADIVRMSHKGDTHTHFDINNTFNLIGYRKVYIGP